MKEVEKLSVVVMTYNEAANIGRCLTSISGIADDVLVVDSFSQDATVAIAESLGARIIQRPFASNRDQRQFCVAQAHYDLVLSLDADEWLVEPLLHAIVAVKTQRTCDGYYLMRHNGIAQRWLRYGGWQPEKKLRLYDRRKIYFSSAEIHEEILLVEGATSAILPGHFFHLTNTDYADRVATINRWSSRAAAELHAKGKKGSWSRLLLKPLYRWVKEYLLQRGFLDGLDGFFVAMTSAQYVFYREAKLLELGRQAPPKATS